MPYTHGAPPTRRDLGKPKAPKKRWVRVVPDVVEAESSSPPTSTGTALSTSTTSTYRQRLPWPRHAVSGRRAEEALLDACRAVASSAEAIAAAELSEDLHCQGSLGEDKGMLKDVDDKTGEVAVEDVSDAVTVEDQICASHIEDKINTMDIKESAKSESDVDHRTGKTKEGTIPFSPTTSGLTLQSMKFAFTKRDYQQVFSTRVQRWLYFEEYVPSRVLAYASLFHRHRDVLFGNMIADAPLRVASIGGGAGSELMALEAIARNGHARLHVDLYDNADWSDVIATIKQQSAEDRNTVDTLTQTFTSSFFHEDVLDENSRFASTLPSLQLVTFMFVLNELFAASKAKTVRLLTALVNNLPAGARVLVVESAGSFSSLQVGEGGNSMMVYRLLDRIAAFEQMVVEDATWYRPPDDLSDKRGFKLNSMRCFCRVYKVKARTASSATVPQATVGDRPTK